MVTSNFISDLLRAANEISKLTRPEMARLLLRAANTIRDYREQIALSGGATHDLSQDDIVFELNAMASAIDIFPAEKVSAMLLEAVQVMKACKADLAQKRGPTEDDGRT
ncbi:hypothetical protein [Aminobacter sp. MET-1]|uniref:hypothetical protein n=1 Tax=Aminobacter sp. MET-1 TaxID=2951085 RepID=UPI00226A3527|nr:hypothetical protein [Aminobacter sp. MET-1]MCX8572984.1 hypothetical protein [Aminobacter sp. MET-1]